MKLLVELQNSQTFCSRVIQKRLQMSIIKKNLTKIYIARRNTVYYWWSGYQKVIHLTNDTPNQLSKFWTKNWVEVNDNSHGTYGADSQIKFKVLMLSLILCDYSDANVVVSETITINKENQMM